MAVRNVLMACAQRRTLAIEYQSMSFVRPLTRGIAPYGIADDGFRCHIRAYCIKGHVLKYFVLSRILNSELAGPAETAPVSDADWMEAITQNNSAPPFLSEDQKRMAELDCWMTDRTAQVAVRKWHLFYSLKKLGLNTEVCARAPQDQHVVLVNMSEVQPILGRKIA
ncbi:MAG: WYL domain-containing protein [Sulfitobacter sp.]|uniref:WYL domain-containing protein n=1 Tax=Alphaproteobacteria TaxID=28211 RepID=UPI002943BE73|nr:WYL domain-containing protein [Sulfitobacter sp. LC.270.F.C4]WOI14885.1 WYL domain-containing protein [Sulfitobacter sp. LC.270.F.C4]